MSTTVPDHLPKGDWSEQAVRILNERYARKDAAGRPIETPDEIMYRVARAVAEAERGYAPPGGGGIRAVETWTDRFYQLLVSRRFLPNSPTLMNAGKNNGLQLSACFVLPVEDSMTGIFDTIKHAALIHKSGGGTGFAFSRLRPKGAMVGSSQGVASGPVSFMQIFDAATDHVKQGGTRRGANMGILRVDHPDILEFINCKRAGGVTNFNISVGMTDAFMATLREAFQADAEGRELPQFPLRDPRDGTVVRQINPLELWQQLIEAAWQTGDPGLVFLDRANAGPANPVPALGPIESTNPCGEQFLYPYDACNLGSINLARFARPAPGTTVEQQIDWDALRETVHYCVRFLDDVIDVNPYVPEVPEIEQTVRQLRRIGLGVMGWADLLFQLEVPYASPAATALGAQVMRFITEEATAASVELGQARGSFPLFEQSIYKDQYPALRNACLTTVAPTGTISIIAGCSSGIEPIFALAYQHTVPQPDGTTRVLNFVNPIFEQKAREQFPDQAEKLIAHARQYGHLKDVDWETEAEHTFCWVFETAHEIEPEAHLQMQAAFQQHTQNAVSKTINLPHHASVEAVAQAYLAAYELGCLGITVYRDGSKGWQVLNVGVTAEQPATDPAPAPAPAPEPAPAAAAPLPVTILPRPDIMYGYTRKIQAPEGTVNITINSDDEGIFELFVNVGKAGSDLAASAEALGRAVSLLFRLPSPLGRNDRAQAIIKQLRGIGGSRSVGFGPNRIKSLADGIAWVLEEYLRNEQVEPAVAARELGGEPAPGQTLTGDFCPECDSQTLVRQEGCTKCLACGYSMC